MVIAKRIVAWRESKGLDQHEFADLVGVTHAAVYQWERGMTSPSLATLEKIAKKLGVTMERFYGEVPPKAKAAS